MVYDVRDDLDPIELSQSSWQCGSDFRNDSVSIRSAIQR